MITGTPLPTRYTPTPTNPTDTKGTGSGTPEPVLQGVQLLQGPAQPPGTIALRLKDAAPLWIAGTEDIVAMFYMGDPQDLNPDEVQAVAQQYSGTGAHHAAPGEKRTLQIQITGGELHVIMAAPEYPQEHEFPPEPPDVDDPDDFAGTPGATPFGQIAADTAALIAHKVELVPQLLDAPLPPVLSQIVMGYLGTAIGGSDETLPLTPLDVVAKMLQTATAYPGTRIYLPTLDGTAAVQGIFLGHNGDNDSALVLLEAPPPPEAGFDPTALHPHPNGLSVIYSHPMEIKFWRDPVQPPRLHVVSDPPLQALQAAVGRTVLLAPASDEVGLPVQLLAVTPLEGEPGEQLLSLQVRSNFHPHTNPLQAWEGGGYVGDANQVKDVGAGQYEWTVLTDLASDGVGCAWATLDPLAAPPDDKGAAASADDKRAMAGADEGAPSSQPAARLGASDFSTMAEGTPLLLNGVEARFLGATLPNEAAESIWVTAAADANETAFEPMYSRQGPDPAQRIHLVRYTQTTVQHAQP